MTNMYATASSRSNFCPAIALMIGSLSMAPVSAQVYQMPEPRLDKPVTYSSYAGVSEIIARPAPIDFSERLGNFYSKLSAAQQDLDVEMQKVLLANINSLYED